MQQQPVISVGICLSSKDSKSCDSFRIRWQLHVLNIQGSLRGWCLAAASVVPRDLPSALSGHGIAKAWYGVKEPAIRYVHSWV